MSADQQAACDPLNVLTAVMNAQAGLGKVSDTPRTDAVIEETARLGYAAAWHRMAQLATELERELNAREATR